MSDVIEALRGRRESALLAFPSVEVMASTLSRCCRDRSWVRTTVASLDRFARFTDNGDLEALMVRSKRDPLEATAALERFALALDGYTKSQIAALAMAPKIWFALNGVPAPWRPLREAASVPPIYGTASLVDRVVLLGLVGSGLQRSELARVRLGDLGSLDATGAIVHDLDAEPLAIRFVQARGDLERITFFSDHARDAIRASLARRVEAGERLDARSPLVATTSGRRATRATFARSSKLNASLIEAGNSANVELCRMTGRFFRTWGLPGARFVDAQAAIEETV